MTTMIKTSVCNPNFPSLFHHRSNTLTPFKNVSLQMPSRIHHPISLQILSRTAIPILHSHKQEATTPVIFKCRCAMDNFLAEIKIRNYSTLWNRARKLLTPLFIYVFYFRLFWVLPKWIYVVSLLSIFKVTPFGKLSKRMEPENFALDDLVGVEDAKTLFQKILRRVHISKSKVLKWGPPDGVLLYGPPGTGKTTLVHAVARKAKVPFFAVSARDIAMAKAGKKEVEYLCAEARVYKPSIVYIKDIDAIDPNYPMPRGNGEFGVTLDEFCHEMETCMNGGNVMVIATTDRRETLDRSLMSLFFRKVHVGRPNTDNRRKFIGLQLNKFLKEEDREAICNLVASRTSGVVWGHLRKIANISLMLADIKDDDYVTMDVVLQALEKVKPWTLDIKTSQLIRDDKPGRVLNDQMEHMVDTMDFGYQN